MEEDEGLGTVQREDDYEKRIKARKKPSCLLEKQKKLTTTMICSSSKKMSEMDTDEKSGFLKEREANT